MADRFDTEIVFRESDRRIFPRLPGSLIPWLKATTPYSPQPLALVDISNGGALIETERRLKPGEREPLVLRGDQDIKVAAQVLRVEIVQLQPTLAYRSAVRFLRPISLEALGAADHDLALLDSAAKLDALADLRARLESQIRQLERIEEVKICSSLSSGPSRESVYFDISDATSGRRRFIQIFFAPGTAPSEDEFSTLKALARLAADLPSTDE